MCKKKKKRKLSMVRRARRTHIHMCLPRCITTTCTLVVSLAYSKLRVCREHSRGVCVCMVYASSTRESDPCGLLPLLRSRCSAGLKLSSQPARRLRRPTSGPYRHAAAGALPTNPTPTRTCNSTLADDECGCRTSLLTAAAPS